MDVYYYCSYTGSPVGFIMGKLDKLSGVCEADALLELNRKDIEPFIRKCFERGLVRNACGRLSKKTAESEEPEQRYFLLFKDLVANGGQDDLEYYLNIAFVTENPEEYLRWLDVGETVTTDTIAQAIRESISLNRKSDFGYDVSGRGLAALTKMKFGSLLGECRAAMRDGKDGLYFELASHGADMDEVMQALGISSEDHELEFISESKNWVRVIKKKPKRKHLALWAVLLLVSVLGLVIYLLTHKL